MTDLVYKSPKGNPITDSNKVADKFGKKHQHVMRDIRSIKDDLADVSKFGQMFFESETEDSKGRKQPFYVMNRKGFSLLALRFRGKKAMVFQLEYIERFEQMEEAWKSLKNDIETLATHTKRPTQIQNSKEVNAYYWNIGGTQTIAQYNREHCRKVSGYTPSELMKLAKAQGLKSKLRSSGKEVLRNTKPELACRMSLDDDLVKHGASLEEALALTASVAPLFAKMIQLGMRPAELSA